MRRYPKATLSAVLIAAALGGPAPTAGAADPDPDEFTPPGYEFCGWRDYANGGWAMEWNDDLYGAYLIAYADGMSCRAARRNVTRIRYAKSPPYAPSRPGYRCKRLKQAHEYSDVRCVKKGGSRTFRFQTGA